MQIRRVVDAAAQGPVVPGGITGISVKANQVTWFGRLPTDKPRLVDWLLPDLEHVAKHVDLPDVEFAIWFGDGAHFDPKDCIPVFVQEKDKDDGGIFAPPRSATGLVRESNPIGAAGAAASVAVPFERKHARAVFRGSLTGGDYTLSNWRTARRSRIVQLSLDRPDLLDARLVVADSSPLHRDMRAAGFLGGFMTPDEQSRRFQMIVVPDGNSVPDRLASLLALDIAVLKPVSNNAEYWYAELVPYRHFIPVREDGSDLLDVIESVRHNTSLLRRIARESTIFIRRRLNPTALTCYWGLLLQEYSELLHNGERARPEQGRSSPVRELSVTTHTLLNLSQN